MKNNPNNILAKILTAFVFLHATLAAESKICRFDCLSAEGGNSMVCGFDIKKRDYKMFPSSCSMESYSKCYESDYVKTPLRFCINEHFSSSRRLYGESCPVFCPEYYRPVCGVSKYRDYVYRTFNNGCYLDMINCRGDDDYTGYIEVPLQYCQRHLMKNIFKERISVSNTFDYRDYN